MLAVAQASNIDSGLVAHYPFDGNAQDVSGNSNHGIVVGASLSTDRFGNTDRAYSFDGVDDYIEYIPNKDFQPTLPITISAWVLLKDYGRNMVFANNWRLGSYHGVFMGNATDGGKTIYVQYGDGGTVRPSSRRTKGGTTELNLDTWYHVGVVVRGPRDMDIYINGRYDCGFYDGSGGEMAYLPEVTGQSGISDPFRQVSTLDFFNGKIDDLRFWNRALEPEEILALQDLDLRTVASDTRVCQGTILTLDVGEASSYRWSPSLGLSCTDCRQPELRVTEEQTYQVTVTNSSGCETSYAIRLIPVPCDPSGEPLNPDLGTVFNPDVICQAKLYNVFTPNGDGYNDGYAPQLGVGLDRVEWQIFDRWGRSIFKASDPESHWDGSMGGKVMPEGVYYVSLTYRCGGEIIREKSSLTLLR